MTEGERYELVCKPALVELKHSMDRLTEAVLIGNGKESLISRVGKLEDRHGDRRHKPTVKDVARDWRYLAAAVYIVAQTVFTGVSALRSTSAPEAEIRNAVERALEDFKSAGKLSATGKHP